MIRKIVISVLFILAVVIASAGIADCGPYDYSWGTRSDRPHGAAVISVLGGDLQVIWVATRAGRSFSSVRPAWIQFNYTAADEFFFFAHCPFWIPMLVLAAYPTFAFFRGPLRRYRRRRRGLCPKCGYNLEGNVSGVCSECGTTLTPGKAL